MKKYNENPTRALPWIRWGAHSAPKKPQLIRATVTSLKIVKKSDQLISLYFDHCYSIKGLECQYLSDMVKFDFKNLPLPSCFSN